MPVTVFIGTPGDQAVLAGGSFETSGNVSPPGVQMFARVRDAAAQEIAGESQPPRPGYDWTFRFPSVSRNEPLTLTVRGVDPMTQEVGEASHTLRCGYTAAPTNESAAPVSPASERPAAPELFPPTPAAEPVEETTAAMMEEVEIPAALPPATMEASRAATAEPPAEAAVPEAARRRPRPAARRKPVTRAGKGARVPAGRRAKASPAKAARTPAARRSRGPAKKVASAMNRKAARKSAGKTSKAPAKKSKAAPKKVKAKTAKVAASGARRGTKPSAKKASKAVAKTNPKKRHSR